jgi:hypothetical protein
MATHARTSKSPDAERAELGLQVTEPCPCQIRAPRAARAPPAFRSHHTLGRSSAENVIPVCVTKPECYAVNLPTNAS